MKQLIKNYLLTVLVALVSVSASAHDFEVDGIYYKVLSFSDLTCEVTYKGDNKYSSAQYNGNVNIPSTVTYNGKTLRVTDISDYTFYYNRSLESVDIPNSVTSIGASAFEGCDGLTSVNIPNSVTSIGEKAFYQCSSLISMDIPNSMTSIVENLFSNCYSLTSIDIPNSVTSIGHGAFSGCRSLISINIPNSVTSIGHGAFSGCTCLTSINIPNSVTSIGEAAFLSCTSLISMDIPNSVTSIGDEVFIGCTSLISVNIPNSVQSIGYRFFEDCGNLTSISIPNSVTKIGERAFEDCSSLTSIVIPNSVTSIGERAFRGCTNLTSAVIGNSVTNIGAQAFDKLSQIEVKNSYSARMLIDHVQKLIIAEDYVETSLPDINYSKITRIDTLVCKLSTPPTLYDTFSNEQYLNLVVIVPTESLATYQSTDVWKNFWCLKGGAENEVSGINNVTVDNSYKPTAIYDLQGRKLTKPQKGINIINGKKVVVK